jgi:RHS repeat-associated protein
VFDAAGNVIETRDSKGALTLHAYDVLNRPIRLWARDQDAQLLATLRERLEYGDGGDPHQTQNERDVNRLAKRLGKLHSHYDEAGLLTFETYDFKGNICEKIRHVFSDAAILASFEPPPANWQVQVFYADWEASDDTLLLDPTEYRTSLTYDALNRIRKLRYPQDVGGDRKELRADYDHAGSLERVELDGTSYVRHIAHSASGQRSLIAYGNGVMTRYAYDPYTFRLAALRTERYTQPDAATYHPIGLPLQDCLYEHDLAGNLLRIIDRTPGCGVINTALGADALIRNFTHDPLYRLRSSTGRECKDIATPRPATDDPQCGFDSGNQGTPNQQNAPHLTAMYQEEYGYDPACNMVSLKHSTSAGSWTRTFGIGGLSPFQWDLEWPNHLGSAGDWLNPPGNRLTHVGGEEAGVVQTHFHDANGNLVRETASRHFDWDHDDRLRGYRTQINNAEPSVHAQYFYDANGRRVKKLVRKQGGRSEITVYIDGIFEHQRRRQASSVWENNLLHVMDNQSRVALVRAGPAFPDDSSPAVKFHLGDHLGSSTVVVGSSGDWINREEYTSYGETSFSSFAHKRYRFTAKERDEESGLYYYGARYYAPWIGRWISCDSLDRPDGANLYEYVRSAPLALVDREGKQGSTSQGQQAQAGRDVMIVVEPKQVTLSEQKKRAKIAGEQRLTSETLHWAQQWAKKDPSRRIVVVVDGRESYYDTVGSVTRAAQLAGRGGRVIIAIGHGAADPKAPNRVPWFNMAADFSFKVHDEDLVFQNHLDDVRTANDPKQNPEARKAAQERVEKRIGFLLMGIELRKREVREVMFLTCSLGGDDAFMTRVSTLLQTPVVSNRYEVATQESVKDPKKLDLYLLKEDKVTTVPGTRTADSPTELPTRGWVRVVPSAHAL